MLIDAIIEHDAPIRSTLENTKELLDLDSVTYYKLCLDVTAVLTQRCRLMYSDDMEDKLRIARTIRDEAGKEI